MAKYEFTVANDHKYSRKANGLVLVHFRCPFCRAKLNEYVNHIGTDDKCPACEKSIVIGGSAEGLDKALEYFSQREREEQEAAEKVAAQKVRTKQEKQAAKEEKRKRISEAQERVKKLERTRAAARELARQEKLEAEQKANYKLKTNEFQKQTGWESFWGTLAGINFMIAFFSLAFVLSDEYTTVAIPFLTSGISGGLVSLFFGWVSGVLNHIRWLNSIQAFEAKQQTTEAKQQTEMLSRICDQKAGDTQPPLPLPPKTN